LPHHLELERRRGEVQHLSRRGREFAKLLRASERPDQALRDDRRPELVVGVDRNAQRQRWQTSTPDVVPGRHRVDTHGVMRALEPVGREAQWALGDQAAGDERRERRIDRALGAVDGQEST
jgi:hypothetical protein